MDPISLVNQKTPPLPNESRPIVIVGAGNVVQNAHLPAYRKAGFPVAAIVDLDLEKASRLAAENGIGLATTSLSEAIDHAPKKSVFDIAVPAAMLPKLLPLLPDGSAVLMQKPMGETIEEAEIILSICRKKRLTAAVNFQLRWAPNMLAATGLRDAGMLGAVHDMEVQVNVHQPWEIWPFLANAPRLEILYHSIHYIDLMRSWLGDPQGVYAKTVRNPRTPNLAATKSVIVLDYGDWKRAYIATNHSHDFGPALQRSYIQWEGTEGAVRAKMGVNLNYPVGEPDTLEYVQHGKPMRLLPIQGNWFPDAFMGSMGSLQAHVEGTTDVLPASVEDAIKTMRIVEAAYRSSRRGGEPIPIAEP